MPAFLVMLHRSGPEWDPAFPLEQQPRFREHAEFMDGLIESGFLVVGGPLADEFRNVHIVEADSEEAVRTTFARDPWSGTHLDVASIEPMTIRLDCRNQ